MPCPSEPAKRAACSLLEFLNVESRERASELPGRRVFRRRATIGPPPSRQEQTFGLSCWYGSSPSLYAEATGIRGFAPRLSLATRISALIEIARRSHPPRDAEAAWLTAVAGRAGEEWDRRRRRSSPARGTTRRSVGAKQSSATGAPRYYCRLVWSVPLRRSRRSLSFPVRLAPRHRVRHYGGPAGWRSKLVGTPA